MNYKFRISNIGVKLQKIRRILILNLYNGIRIKTKSKGLPIKRVVYGTENELILFGVIQEQDKSSDI